MKILSDTEIRDHLSHGRLVIAGHRQDAAGCSYSFKPGKIFPAGPSATAGEPLDWDVPNPAPDVYMAQPGAMFWVRTSLQVKLPANVCAFWWQTNTLSRKGISLVNMSMVDPGYEGWLACLFVNFGNQNVPIFPHTTVARLVFVELDAPVSSPFTAALDRPKYDAELHAVAMNSASSFLQVNEHAASVSGQLDKLREELTKQASDLGKSLAADLRLAADKEADEIRKNLVEALKKLLWPYVAWVVLAVGVWGAMNWAADWLRPTREEQVKKAVESEFVRSATREEIRRAVDEALRARLSGASAAVSNAPTGAAPKTP